MLKLKNVLTVRNGLLFKKASTTCQINSGQSSYFSFFISQENKVNAMDSKSTFCYVDSNTRFMFWSNCLKSSVNWSESWSDTCETGGL